MNFILGIATAGTIAITASLATGEDANQTPEPLPVRHINCPFPSHCTVGLARGSSLISEPEFEPSALSVEVHMVSDQEYLVVTFNAEAVGEQEANLMLKTSSGTHRFIVSGKPRQTGDWVMLD